jgi:hypothetical protein
MEVTLKDGSDPTVDYLRLQELAKELWQFLTRLEGMYLDAIAGFSLVRGRIVADQTEVRKLVAGTECDSEQFQDGRLFTYDLIFKEPFCGSEYHRVTQGEAKARNSLNGSNYVTLGQLCVVSLYDYWNEYLRKEYVIAKGLLERNEVDSEIVKTKLREHASFDLWGDLRAIRNAIIHNRSIATPEVAKCKWLRWFNEGDRIDIDPGKFQMMLLVVFRFGIDVDKEGFPKSYIQIPLSK